MESQHNIYALLVGINKYQYRTKSNRSIDLKGCLNDVELISGMLKARYNLPSKQCLKLTDEAATKKNIISGFKTHLGKAKKGDSAIFYFSGHGSTEKADPRMWVNGEQDHRNETLVCHDSRASDLYDLSDKELRFLIHQLSEKNINIVTIIDSCNSGDATRYIGDDIEEQVARQTPSSNATRPLDSYIFFDEPEAQHWLNDFSKMPEGNHVAISACRNDQLSKEVYFKWDKYGAFTYSLCEAIKHQHFAPSYRNLVDAAAQRVSVKVENQTPQLETIGKDQSIHQTFLASEVQPVIYPVSHNSDSWWLNAGVAQGINHGARLNLLLEGKKIAEVEVVEVSPADAPENGSRLAIEYESTNLDKKLRYQAQMVDPAIAKLPIHFIGSEQHVAELNKVLKDSDTQHYLHPTDDVEYVLEASDESIKFKRHVGLPLAIKPVVTIKDNPARELVALKLAAHMAQWEHTKSLVYVLEDQLIPNNLVEFVVEQQNPNDGKFVKLKNDSDVFNLYYQQNTRKTELSKPVIKLSLELNTDANWAEDEDVFVSLLLMDPVKGSATVLANKEVLRTTERKDRDGNASIIKPARPKWTYFRSKNGVRKEEVRFSVSESLLTESGEGKTTDYLKLIISNFEIDIGALEQSSLQKLLDRLNPEAVRGIKGIDDEDEEYESGFFVQKASTKTFVVNVIKPPSSQPLDDKKPVELSSQVTVLPHDMSAIASLEYAKDNPASIVGLRLDFGDDSSKGLKVATNSLHDAPLILEIDSPKGGEHEGLLVFSKEHSGGEDKAFDIPIGFGFYDARSGKTRVVINQLPETESSGDRSVGGSLLLFFKKVVYEKLKLNRDTSRLAIPKFSSPHSLEVAEYIDDVETIKKEVVDADKIIVFIHGIIGDTQVMAGAVNREISGKRFGDGYLTLTFDYENLNTPIQETADLFRKRLGAVGLVGDHGKELVIIAHSMGGLVSRWMIEKDPACPKVSKLIMLGTPNGGSPFNKVKKWLVTMITLATNGVAGVAGGIGVSGLMYMLNNMDDTLDEMGVESKTLEYLYEAGDPEIPYYIIAGDTAQLKIQLNDKDSRLSRLLASIKQHSWLGLTDMFNNTLFDEANDIAVSHSSMAHVPKGRTYQMPLFEVDADHVSYFVNDKAINHLHESLKDKR